MPPSNLSETSSVVTIEDGKLSKEAIIDILGEETETSEALDLDKDKGRKTSGDAEKDGKEKDDKGEKKGEEKEEEKEELSLEDELEEELKEPDEKKLELVAPVRRKEILAKYPNIFKEFPALENAYYREQAYANLLPTIKDAKEAVEKAKTLDTYEQEIMGGSTESLLSAVKDGDKEAFNRVVDNYLPILYKVDEGAYYHTVGNIIKNTIMSMVRDSKEAGSDELLSAANVVNQYIFGTSTFTPPQKLAAETQEDKDKINAVDEREKQFVERQFNTAEGEINTKIDNILKSTIDKYIDPNDSMTGYVKVHASREVLDNIKDVIDKDTRFKTVLDRLWERAFSNDFDSTSMDAIRKAYLSKAQTLLPALIRKARNEALKGLGKRTKEESDNEDNDKQGNRKGPIAVGRARSAASSPNSGKTDRDRAKAIPRGTTTLDFLNQD